MYLFPAHIEWEEHFSCDNSVKYQNLFVIANKCYVSFSDKDVLRFQPRQKIVWVTCIFENFPKVPNSKFLSPHTDSLLSLSNR